MYWRRERGGRQWEQSKGQPNRRALHRLVVRGRVDGALALSGEEPVGWCCVGPRAGFPRLERTRALASEWNERTWSVVCFFILPGWRGRGVAAALLRRGVSIARRRGARELEAYPVPLDDQDVRYPATFAFTGVPRLFEGAGFRPVGGKGAVPRVWVRRLRPPRRHRGDRGSPLES